MIPVIWRFWLLRRNNIITTTKIKQLKPYMYQLISFKIILHLHLLVKLSMEVVFVSQKFKNYGWRVFTQGTRGFFLHAAAHFNIRSRPKPWAAKPLEKTSGTEGYELPFKANFDLSIFFLGLHLNQSDGTRNRWNQLWSHGLVREDILVEIIVFLFCIYRRNN